MMIEEFIQRIEKKKALVGVIGMGYVGLPLILRFCEQNFRTLGFDIDPIKWPPLRREEATSKPSHPQRSLALFRMAISMSPTISPVSRNRIAS